MLLINAVNAAGRPVELFVKDGKIAAVGQDLSALAGEGETVLDAGGLTVLPGCGRRRLHLCQPDAQHKAHLLLCRTGSYGGAEGRRGGPV